MPVKSGAAVPTRMGVAWAIADADEVASAVASLAGVVGLEVVWHPAIVTVSPASPARTILLKLDTLRQVIIFS